VNSHVGSWSPKWTPKFSKCNCRGQNSLFRSVLYIIGKILKCRCLKWACITHLDIWKTSYGQKKGRKSNWQFDFWPLKVENQPDFLGASSMKHTFENLSTTAITLLQTSLQSKVCTWSYASQSYESSNYGNFGTPIWKSWNKKAIRMWPMWRGAEYTIRGKVVASPKFRPWWVLWVQSCPWLVLAPKVL
jgi:hypothetical protein